MVPWRHTTESITAIYDIVHIDAKVQVLVSHRVVTLPIDDVCGLIDNGELSSCKSYSSSKSLKLDEGDFIISWNNRFII